MLDHDASWILLTTIIRCSSQMPMKVQTQVSKGQKHTFIWKEEVDTDVVARKVRDRDSTASMQP